MINDFKSRQSEWCLKTGLKLSKARNTKVLRWMNEYSLPSRFDHTGIYYCRERKFHLMITEPYHTTSRALKSLAELADSRDGDFCYVLGMPGHGLWYPGHCFSLLIAKIGYYDFLVNAAKILPK